jgi:FkbM family methyltransferase
MMATGPPMTRQPLDKAQRLAAGAAVALAQRLPVAWLRLLNQCLYRTARGRRALNRIRWSIAEEPAVIGRGPLVGAKFIAGGGQPAYLLGAAEPDLQDALCKCVRAGDVVYDVGANVGFFTLLVARLVDVEGHVYAFEPVPANALALQRNLDLNEVQHVSLIRSAVGTSSGHVRMALGSNYATAHLADHGPGLVTVPCTTIDAFVAGRGRPPDVVKIDVEGAEALVLRGMVDTLRAHRPIVLCEVHHTPADRRRALMSEILLDAGYDEHLLALDGGKMPHLLGVPREEAVPAGLRTATTE